MKTEAGQSSDLHIQYPRPWTVYALGRDGCPGRMKKIAQNLVASHLNASQIEELRDAFLTMDKNGDGCARVVGRSWCCGVLGSSRRTSSRRT